jgi:hypothetical protein
MNRLSCIYMPTLKMRNPKSKPCQTNEKILKCPTTTLLLATLSPFHPLTLSFPFIFLALNSANLSPFSRSSLFLARSAAMRVESSLALVLTLCLTLATLSCALSVILLSLAIEPSARTLIAVLVVSAKEARDARHTAKLPQIVPSLLGILRQGFSRTQKIRQSMNPMEQKHRV